MAIANSDNGIESKGHLHVMTQAIREAALIFEKLGFVVSAGPELETEFYNFDALNIPSDHPARDMQDTFWVYKDGDTEKKVLRTHTTSVQVRHMQAQQVPKPLKVVVPGKVFRNEATDATHEAQFHQIDGLYVNKEVSMADLKGVLSQFCKAFIGPDAEIRFRPSYFAFVEPGVEVDVRYKGKWLEIFGAGLIHPTVLKAGGYDPQEWQGFAFGGGIDRLIMLRYGIDDVRHLYSGDLRLLRQF
jgi:phenylalanyl-tRNA synthetase alpha chain